jgi:hypothetical protein
VTVARPLVITPCTSRKRNPPRLLARDLPPGGQAQLSGAWLSLLEQAQPDRPAMDLYVGSAFVRAKKAASLVGADLAVISAGLGLVMGNTVIPSYNLTLSRGGVSTQVSGDFDSALWWDAISRGPYATDFVHALRHRPLVLVCLSRAYAPLVVTALRTVPRERLRIFGLGLEGVLPADLAECVLPYDTRLGVTVLRGTLADFAQRALFHYVSEIRSKPDSLEDDRSAVIAAFDNVVKPAPLPKRMSIDDASLREVIAELLPTVGHRRSAMLRYLRDAKGTACEQGRFARLFMEVVNS